MITISIGTDVNAFICRVRSRTGRFKEVVICSPFIDVAMSDHLALLLLESRRTQCALRVITTPMSMQHLLTLLPGRPAFWRGDVVSCRSLHAKVYLAVARRPYESEAIVTSANLTTHGTSKNIELGIRVLGTTAIGRRILGQVHHFIRRVAA